MSLDQLPDELLIKIFRYVIKAKAPHHDRYWFGTECRDVPRLRLTCKRFLRLANNQLYTIFDKQYPKIPQYKIGKHERGLVIRDQKAEIECVEQIKLITSFKHVKCRNLNFSYLDLTTSTCPTLIRNEQSKLKAITELEISGCKLDVATLSNIIESLSNLKRLIFSGVTINPGHEPNLKQLTSRTLACLVLDECCGYGNLVDYVLEKIPTHELLIDKIEDDITLAEYIEGGNNLHLSWLKRYLIRHHATLKRCDIYVVTLIYFSEETANTDHVVDLVRGLNLGYSIKRGKDRRNFFHFIITKDN